MNEKTPSKTFNPLLIIFITIFFDMLGFGILIPIIPLLLADPSSQFYLLSNSMNINLGYIYFGLLLAVFPLFQFLSSPILGQLSDKHGRKNILMYSIFVTFISYLLFAYAIIDKNIPLLFLSRAIHGLASGSIAVAYAAIADVTTVKNRAKNFGLIGAAFGLGFIVGPFIGGKLSDHLLVSWFNASTPFLFASILSLINLILVYTFFTETHEKNMLSEKVKLNQSIKNILKAYKYKETRLLFLITFLYTTGFTFFTTFFSVYLIIKFGFTQGNIGDFFAYAGVFIALTQGVLVRVIAPLFKIENIIKIGLFGSSVTIILYFIPNAWWGLLIVAPLFSFFNGITMANLPGLISAKSDQKIQGEIMGINSSVQAFAQILPPIIAGVLAYSLTPLVPLFTSSIIILLAAITFTMFYKTKKEDLTIKT